MSNFTPLFLAIVSAAAGFFATTSANAAFIIEASDAAGRLGEGRFAYTGPGGTAPSYSTASAGQLPAYVAADPTPPASTFFTLRHAYGGNGTTDQYTFSYSPVIDGDNVAFTAGTVFNLLGTDPDLRSSGLNGGIAGIYNVYRIHPANPNVTGGNTTYQVFVNGGLQLTEAIVQNAANVTTGRNIGRWELIGSVSVPSASDVVTVTMAPTSSTFVSMRASGIMFEYVSPIPEPSTAALLGLALGSLVTRRRCRN